MVVDLGLDPDDAFGACVGVCRRNIRGEGGNCNGGAEEEAEKSIHGVEKGPGVGVAGEEGDGLRGGGSVDLELDEGTP